MRRPRAPRPSRRRTRRGCRRASSAARPRAVTPPGEVTARRTPSVSMSLRLQQRRAAGHRGADEARGDRRGDARRARRRRSAPRRRAPRRPAPTPETPVSGPSCASGSTMTSPTRREAAPGPRRTPAGSPASSSTRPIDAAADLDGGVGHDPVDAGARVGGAHVGERDAAEQRDDDRVAGVELRGDLRELRRLVAEHHEVARRDDLGVRSRRACAAELRGERLRARGVDVRAHDRLAQPPRKRRGHVARADEPDPHDATTLQGPTRPSPASGLVEEALLDQLRAFLGRDLDVARREHEDLVGDPLHAAVERVREAAGEVDQALAELGVGRPGGSARRGCRP